MVAANPADIRKIAEGFRGRFYWNGNRMATCTNWRVERAVRRTDVQVLDDPTMYSKLDSVSYTLVFEEFTITHALPKAILDADAQGQDVTFRFIGEEIRGDGAVARWICDQAVSDGTTMLGGAQVGQPGRRTYNWRLNGAPVPDALWV